MSYLKVIANEHQDYYMNHEEDQLDSWKSSNSHSVEGIEVVKKHEHYDLVREDEVKNGDVLYLVVVQYSTGDSFGNASGLIEFVDTFRTLEAAKACLEAVERSSKIHKENSKPFTYIMDNGAVYYSEYTSWNGYFDSLEDVYIKQLTVGMNSGKIRKIVQTGVKHYKHE